MRASPLFSRSSNKAAALIIVLAFVVLVTGLALAYFTRTTTDRQLAQSSYNDTSADLLARSALDIVVGDFKQEIVNGSNPTVLGGATIYVPAVTPNVVPQRNVSVSGSAPSPVPNLIRISLRGDPIPTPPVGPAVGSRASDVSSTDPSANGRSISNTRWNKHCLISGDLSTATIDNPVPVSPAPYPTPVSGQTPASWDPPDWVIVTRAGPTPFDSWDATLADPSVTNTNYAIGRYAYAVYDEGGLIDINLAAYPTPVATQIPEYTTDIGRKAVPTWTDLTALLASPTPTPTPAFVSTGGASYTLTPWLAKLLGFRNYATSQQSNVSNLDFPASRTAAVPNTAVQSFMNYFLGGNFVDCSYGGQRTAPAVGFSPPGRDFIAVNPTVAPSPGGRTDQSFVTRAELLRFFSTTNILPPATCVNMLQFLGTFSREQNKPTLPLTPGWPNRVVLQQRFFLGNLNCVQQPPLPAGCDADFQKNFGLQPSLGSDGRWQYVGQTGMLLDHISAPDPSGSPAPDFFQILNYAYSTLSPTPTIDKILSLGAAIIDLYDYDYGPPPSPTPFNQVITGIDYAPAPSVAWGAEWWWCGAPVTACPSPSPSVVPMGSPVPSPAPTAIAGYTPSLQRLQITLPCGQSWQTSYEYPFQTSGELGYVYNPITPIRTPAPTPDCAPGCTLDFKDPYDATNNPDPALLDFFTYNSASVRAGIVSLNTHQAPVLVAILKGALPNLLGGSAVNLAQAQAAAYPIVNATIANPALSRADIARLASAVPSASPFNNEEARDTIVRAFSETTQTRTWGLLIDVVAQTGHYKPNATGLADFVVEGEKRYWLHVAIDRFDGSIVGQQLEEVTE